VTGVGRCGEGISGVLRTDEARGSGKFDLIGFPVDIGSEFQRLKVDVVHELARRSFG